MSTPTTATLLVERAGPDHAGALQAFFAAHSNGCFCRWWHFPGDKNDWQLNCATPNANQQAMREAIASHAPEMQGFVALRAEQALGWLKLSEAQAVTKLYDQRLYRGLPCFDGDRQGIYTVGCMLVSPDQRRTGIARSLLQHAIAWAEEHGAQAIEAFPHRAAQHAAGLWLGPHELYQELGFRTVHDFEPYPVLRLSFHA
jgi:GNAT superfamily N-acetyltransferase